MTKWPTHALEDVLEVLIDHRGKTPKKLGSDFSASGIPVASALLVKGGRLRLTEARFVSAEIHDRWMPEKTRLGDVLLTSEAPVGRVAKVTSNEKLVLGQRLFGLRGKRHLLDNDFMFYVLQTREVQRALVGSSTGTTVEGIRQSALRRLQLELPPVATQRAIAAVLTSLDDKIAANERVIATSRNLAVSLSSQADSTCQISELAKLQTKSLKPAEFDASVSHFSLPAFDVAEQPEMCPGSSIKSNKTLVDTPAVLVSKLNPRIPRVWNVPSPRPMSLASTEFVCLLPDGVSTTALWAALVQKGAMVQLASHVSGTSGSHQRVKPADVLALEVPDPRILKPSATATIVALGEVLEHRRRENTRLAATRDELLPLLMSGRISVREAEEVAG